ncbi:RDD family protein [Aeoliella mucimassa]|uniref:RDD family protein n=1 Tax=Aeoliella mucimassa TaxID=2527972 RepID=A0A518AII5_9BACT|nr:RDD family protein [Aeoliella mucimassa]QDU54526.1 RDD family protein [Aeoliella mucimassa]
MSQQNPYASPVSNPLGPGNVVDNVDVELPIATQGKRLLNLIIDNIVLQIVSRVVGVAVGAAMIRPGEVITPEKQSTLFVVAMIMGLIVAVVYFLVMESLFQKTIGKMLTGTKVVDVDGRRPSFQQLLGRSLSRFVPFEAFSFLGGSRPVGWHDSWSGTRVVIGK